MSSLPGQKNPPKFWLHFPGHVVGRGNSKQVIALACYFKRSECRLRRIQTSVSHLWGLCSDWWRLGCAHARSQLGFQEHKVPETRGEGKDVAPTQHGSRPESWAGPCSGSGLCNLCMSLSKVREWWWHEDARMVEGPTQHVVTLPFCGAGYPKCSTLLTEMYCFSSSTSSNRCCLRIALCWWGVRLLLPFFACPTWLHELQSRCESSGRVTVSTAVPVPFV